MKKFSLLSSLNQQESKLLIDPSEAYINHLSNNSRGPSVSYDPSSVFQILFQMHASVWA